MSTPRRHEPRGRWAERELEHLPRLTPHLEAAPVIADGQHRGAFKATAEVRDPRPRAHARYRS